MTTKKSEEVDAEILAAEASARARVIALRAKKSGHIVTRASIKVRGPPAAVEAFRQSFDSAVAAAMKAGCQVTGDAGRREP